MVVEPPRWSRLVGVHLPGAQRVAVGHLLHRGERVCQRVQRRMSLALDEESLVVTHRVRDSSRFVPNLDRFRAVLGADRQRRHDRHRRVALEEDLFEEVIDGEAVVRVGFPAPCLGEVGSEERLVSAVGIDRVVEQMVLHVEDELAPAEHAVGDPRLRRRLGRDLVGPARLAAPLMLGCFTRARVEGKQRGRRRARRQQEPSPAHTGTPCVVVALLARATDRFAHHRRERHRFVLVVGARPELDREARVVVVPAHPGDPSHAEMNAGCAELGLFRSKQTRAWAAPRRPAPRAGSTPPLAMAAFVRRCVSGEWMSHVERSQSLRSPAAVVRVRARPAARYR